MRIKLSKTQKKLDAIQTLIRVGLLIPASAFTLFHGRVGDGSEWEVDPGFDNSGNKTGNHNISKVSTLYTAMDKESAQAYADWHASHEGGIPEVHEMGIVDQDALIFNRMFKVNNLSPEDRSAYYYALDILTNEPPTKYCPVNFEYRKSYAPIIDQMIRNSFPLDTPIAFSLMKDFSQKVLAAISPKSEAEKNAVLLLATSMLEAEATRRALKHDPVAMVTRYLSRDPCKVAYAQTRSGKFIGTPISNNYLKNWLKDLNVIGSQTEVDSRVGDIVAVGIFDLHQISKKQTAHKKQQAMHQKYDGLSQEMKDLIPDEALKTLLIEGSPEEILRSMYTSEKIKGLYDLSTGVWEGWNVAKHTMSLIEFFDQNYSHLFTKEMYPLIKLAFLTHDIGKGKREIFHGRQHEANAYYSQVLLDEVGVPKKYHDLIKFIITESQDYTEQYYLQEPVKKYKDGKVSYDKETTITQKEQLLKQLSEKSIMQLEKAFGRTPTPEEVTALMSVCSILQHCDSAAYTRYACVKDSVGIYCHAGNDRFTKSFVLKDGIPFLKTYEDYFEQEL